MTGLTRTVDLLLLMLVSVALAATNRYSPVYLDEKCGYSLDLSTQYAAMIKLTGNATYAKNMDCKLTLTAGNGKRIRLNAIDFNTPNAANCPQARLDLLNGDASAAKLPFFAGGICGTKSQVTYTNMQSDLDKLTLSFKSDGSEPVSNGGFTLIATQFSAETCTDDEYTCSTGSDCINKVLKCDGQPNCPEASDEKTAGGALCSGMQHLASFLTIILAFIGAKLFN